MFKVPELYRMFNGPLGSTPDYGNNGAFHVRLPSRLFVMCIASDKLGWEHVSVSLSNRCPWWDEMSYIKDLFWEKSDTVVQFHPSEDNYVNNHRYTLHLWRSTEKPQEMPPSILVGIRDQAVVEDLAEYRRQMKAAMEDFFQVKT